MTKSVVLTLLLTTLGLLAGCDRKEKGPAYGQELEFRRQITESIPVKKWGYSVTDIRVSDDAQKVLVVFASSGGTDHTEVVLQNDGFRRYRGTFDSAERIAAAMAVEAAAYAAYNSNVLARMAGGRVGDTPSFNAGAFMSNCSAPIVITLPDR